MVESAPSIPFRPLIAMGRDPTGILDHPRHVHEIPGHERGIAIGEVVLRSARTRVEIRRARASFAQPVSVRLRRNHVPEVLQRIQNIHTRVALQ